MNIRHGDLALIGIDKLPNGLKASASKVLITGSHGNDHTFDHGKFYSVEGGRKNVIGYLKAIKNTTLYHPDHGKIKEGALRETPIPRGIYEVRRQNEVTHNGMKPVID